MGRVKSDECQNNVRYYDATCGCKVVEMMQVLK